MTVTIGATYTAVGDTADLTQPATDYDFITPLAEGPCGSSDCSTDMDSWLLSAESHGATKFYYPMGLPATASAVGTISDIGTAPATSDNLHGDGVNFDLSSIATTNTGAFVSGGDWDDGSVAGIFALELLREDTTSNTSTGFRCMAELP